MLMVRIWRSHRLGFKSRSEKDVFGWQLLSLQGPSGGKRGEVRGHFWSTAKVPWSKAENVQPSEHLWRVWMLQQWFHLHIFSFTIMCVLNRAKQIFPGFSYLFFIMVELGTGVPAWHLSTSSLSHLSKVKVKKVLIMFFFLPKVTLRCVSA